MPGPLRPTRTSEQRRARLIELCRKLPEVAVDAADPHVGFKVRTKTFAWYTFDHHGDGMIALTCKVPRERQRLLIERAPERFFIPPYLGARGWVALRLDRPAIDWSEVDELLRTSYGLIAPKKLALLAM